MAAFWIFLAIISAIFIGLFIWSKKEKEKEQICNQNPFWGILKKINASYHFVKFENTSLETQSGEYIIFRKNTNHSHLNFNREEFISGQLFQNYDAVLEYVQVMYKNLDPYEQYIKEVKTAFKTYHHENNHHEKIKLEENVLHPVHNAKIRLIIRETNYLGYGQQEIREHIEDFAPEKWLPLFERASDKKAMESSVKQERRKMSDSLRYDVLRRDNFRCCICGATAKDGIKLHVDHIVPVSKGGKTTLNNLQTLCERCNLGKSNK